MSINDDLALVLTLASMTEDRAPNEQRAMLAVALRLDLDRGAFVVGNRELQRPRWVRHVAATYDPSDGKPVGPTKSQAEQYARLTERWSLCDECGYPMGAHYADDRCPTLAIDQFRLDQALAR